jgi:hypothetical protein
MAVRNQHRATPQRCPNSTTPTHRVSGFIPQRPASMAASERFDPGNHIISAVTLEGHPLAGWRYWRVYSIGANDVVIETGAYDQPGPGLKNYVGYYLGQGTVSQGWREYMQFILRDLHASQGTHLRSSLGGIPLMFLPSKPYNPNSLMDGYWDYWGDFTNYILTDVCGSGSCH